jgi:chromate reductase
VRILAISGSLRNDSYNTAVLRAAAALVPPGVEVVLHDGLDQIPAYNDDINHGELPPAVERLRAAIAGSDAVLIATPEYNSSIPGQLKNAFDWLSRPLATSPLRNKPAAVVGASTGIFGAVWAQAETRKVLAAIGARVVDTELPVPHAEDCFDCGRLIDKTVESRVRALAKELIAAVGERERHRAPA